jgi:hypothetical protein
MTKAILNLMYKRNFHHRKALQTSDKSKANENWSQYKYLRNKIISEVKKAKSTYYTNLAETTQSSKQFWKNIRDAVPKSCDEKIYQNISPDEFNVFFTNIGEKVVDDNYKNTEEYRWNLPTSLHNFTFTEIDPQNVHKYLLKLNDNGKHDILGFDTKLLKLSAPYIATSLTQIFNVSLREGLVPADWKLAKITPAYKNKGDKFVKDNYRPLSVVGHIAKNIETEVKNQFIDYLYRHNFISSDQSAYLKFHSTTTSLHRLHNDILSNINENENTAICFLDIKKCFDTIDHSILLSKLFHYGVKNTELSWFKSYLSGRRQCVLMNGKTSTEREISTGVPQGTVLGPILFLLFINDLSTSVSNGIINIFADDVSIYISNTSLSVLNTQMSVIMENVFNWYKRNRLVLSIDKCSCMLIKGKKNNTVLNLDISLNGQNLNQVKTMKYLGVIIDEDFTWKPQIAGVCKKLGYNLSKLKRARKVFPSSVIRKMYLSDFVPVLDYACTVWGNTTGNNLKLIQRMEKMAARVITGN